MSLCIAVSQLSTGGAPIKRKYFEERIRPWFIHGESRDGQRVDLSDSDGDVLTNVPREQAMLIMRERYALIEVIWHCLWAHAYNDFDAIETVCRLYEQEASDGTDAKTL